MRLLLVLMLALLIACQSSPSEMHSMQGKTMGTTYSIKYWGPKHAGLQQSVDSLLLVVNASLSTYIPTSTISLINQAEVYGLTDAYFLTNYHKALEVARASEGAFDMTVMPLVNAWGFGFKKMAESVDSLLIDSLRQYVGIDKVWLSGDTLYKAAPQVMVDFSALAKGFGVDEVARLLKQKGIQNFLVEIGGELVAAGRKADGTDWMAGIEKPIEDQSGQIRALEMVVPLKNRAMATSGNYRNFYERDGQKFAHEINPLTGYPAMQNLLSVTIFAPDCMTADAWATACMVMGFERSKSWVESQQAVQAIFIYNDEKGAYQVYKSPGIE
jgi:thiamine biosynthesis lipoprotein